MARLTAQVERAVTTTKNTITVVCTANICRSPMGAALLRHALEVEPEPLRSLEVVSAGVAAFAGEPPSSNSVRALHKVGLSLTGYTSQRLTQSLLEKSILILAMTESHRAMIQQAFPEASVPILLFRESMESTANPEIPDPYGADLGYYEASRDSMVEAIPSIIRYLRQYLGVDQ